MKRPTHNKPTPAPAGPQPNLGESAKVEMLYQVGALMKMGMIDRNMSVEKLAKASGIDVDVIQSLTISCDDLDLQTVAKLLHALGVRPYLHFREVAP